MLRKALILTSGSAVLAVFALAVGPDVALAANGNTNDIFGKLASDLGNWAGEILAPTVGLMGLAALFRRDVGHAVTLAVIAIIIGIFAYAPGGAQHAIHTIVTNLTG